MLFFSHLELANPQIIYRTAFENRKISFISVNMYVGGVITVLQCKCGELGGIDSLFPPKCGFVG